MQKGSIIVFTVLILSAILAITLTLTRIFIPRIKSITEATDSVSAIFAADSAMEWCLYNNRAKVPLLTQPVMANGSTYQIFSDGTPSNCSSGEPPNYRTVGTYRGISRSFEVSELSLNQACNNPTIIGTSNGETLNGTNGDDIIVGNGGNDTINGGNGDDIICAGSGNDIIDGGNNNDTIVDDGGTNTITGGNGNDNITAGSGNDFIDGGTGNDTCNADGGNNTVQNCEP